MIDYKMCKLVNYFVQVTYPLVAARFKLLRASGGGSGVRPPLGAIKCLLRVFTKFLKIFFNYYFYLFSYCLLFVVYVCMLYVCIICMMYIYAMLADSIRGTQVRSKLVCITLFLPIDFFLCS